MKATALFVIAMIVIAMLSTVVLAQTTNAPATANASAVKVVKPVWGLAHTKADYDTLQKEYAAFSDSDDVNLTWGQLRELFDLLHDQILRDGDKRFVNMPGMYKRQVTKTIAAKLGSVTADTKVATTKVNMVVETMNSLAKDVDAVTAKQAKTDSLVRSIAYIVKVLDESATHMRWVLTEDETRVPVPEGVRAVIRTEDATMKAEDAGMELLKLESAARRATTVKK